MKVVDIDASFTSIIIAIMEFKDRYRGSREWAEMEDSFSFGFCPFETEMGTFAVVHIDGNPVGIVPTEKGKIYVPDVLELFEDIEEEYADGYAEDD